MKEWIEYILLIFAFRVFENFVDKKIEKSKLTANTWDDAFWNAIDFVLSKIMTIFTNKKIK
jgi:hypothetical protein